MPLLAEISDKMPTLTTLWEQSVLIGLILAAVTAGLCLAKLRLGGVGAILSVAVGVFLAWPDHIMDPEIIRELGEGYLFQRRVSGFVPFVLALVAWGIVVRIRRHNPAVPGNGAGHSCSANRTPSPRRAS